MEKNQEKNAIELQNDNIQSQYYSSDNQQGRSHTYKRKIHKKYKKQARKAINNPQNQQISPLSTLFKSQTSFFTTSKQESLKRLFESLKNEVHIRQILAFQGQSFANLTIQSCQQQAINHINFLKQYSTSKLQRIGLKANGLSLALNCLQVKSNIKGKQSTNLLFVSSSNASFNAQRLRQMQNIKAYVQMLGRDMGYNTVDISYFNAQLLTLLKMAKTAQKSLLDRLSWISVQQDPLLAYLQQPPIQYQIELKNKYITLLVLKNIQQAFKEQPIDFYNYHRAIENYEDNMYLHLPYQSITNLSAFRKYVLARKHKSNKNSISFLRTPCSACLSHFSQLYNPIENCPECHIRIHRYCQRIQNRCHRCRYGRTSNAEKIKTSFCYICNRPREKGLMIQTVTNCAPHQFAHVFCLYLHNLWHVQNQEIRGEYLLKETDMCQCKFCGIRDGLHFKCQNCGSFLHGMCGYMQGCSFRLQSGSSVSDKNYNVRVNCCGDKQIRRRLCMQRRFKINLQKVIFRQDEQLFKYITQQTKQKL